MSDIGFWVGRAHPVQLLMIEPLFEEANRMRRTLAEIMRALDSAAIGALIPDLCGTGESVQPISSASLAVWRQNVADASKALGGEHRSALVVSFRGGSLIDDAAAATHWLRVAPETGARIVRDLRRTQLAGHGDWDTLAGHRLSAAFVAELEAAVPAAITPLQIARLESDTAEADHRFSGSPIWRRAEPGEDPALIAAITETLIHWARKCADG